MVQRPPLTAAAPHARSLLRGTAATAFQRSNPRGSRGDVQREVQCGQSGGVCVFNAATIPGRRAGAQGDPRRSCADAPGAGDKMRGEHTRESGLEQARASGRCTSGCSWRDSARVAAFESCRRQLSTAATPRQCRPPQPQSQRADFATIPVLRCAVIRFPERQRRDPGRPQRSHASATKYDHCGSGRSHCSCGLQTATGSGPFCSAFRGLVWG